jgi:hypothetical protein
LQKSGIWGNRKTGGDWKSFDRVASGLVFEIMIMIMIMIMGSAEIRSLGKIFKESIYLIIGARILKKGGAVMRVNPYYLVDRKGEGRGKE